MKKLLQLLLTLSLLAWLTRPAAAGTAGAVDPGPPPPPRIESAVVVGSYGGYWGLNDWFMGLLSKYFTLDQMKSIDTQIQQLSGIASRGYNYMGESGSGYLYNSSSGEYTYDNTRVGKHYDAIANTAFVIDVSTASVVTFMASTDFSPAGWYGSSPYIGHTMDVGGTLYEVLDARNWSPIVLDLNDDGIIDVTWHQWRPHAPAFYRQRTAWFDLTGDGLPEYCEWLGKTDGLLVIPEPDGSVRGAQDLFGTAGGYSDGYEKLATLDADHSGWVEGAELRGLKVWIDANGDGKAQPEEMRPVESLGIERIKVAHKNFVSEYVRNGKACRTWDWWPSGFELARLSGGAH